MQPSLLNVAITIALVALIVWRNSRPQRVTVGRLWLAPAILALISAFMVYGTYMMAPGQTLLTAGVLILGAALGIPLGIARGHHSAVRLTDQPGVFYIDPSMIVMIIWVVAFAVRYGLRYFLPNAGAMAMIVGDGFVFFAIGSVIASRIVIFRKYEALRNAQAAA